MNFDAFAVFCSNVSRFRETIVLFDGAIDRYNEEKLPVLRAASVSKVPKDGSKQHLDEMRLFAMHLADSLSKREAVFWQNGWYIVMMATITETYLLDSLIEAGKYDPSFMDRSEQTLTYAEVSKADTVESLAHRMRERWAKGIVQSGGPKRWLERLKRWGANGLTVEMTSELERMWGIRHVMVHRAGKVDADFLSRHSQFEADERGNLQVSSDDAGKLSLIAIDFVKCVNSYLENRCEQKHQPSA